MFSGEQFAKPSAVLNSVCNTSPPKFWHNLSNICRQSQNLGYKQTTDNNNN